MALRKDENQRSTSSYRPYNSSNSFAKKVSDRVSEVIGWRSKNISVDVQNNTVFDSSYTEDDDILPAAKRSKSCKEQEGTLSESVPNTSEASKKTHIQPFHKISLCKPESRPANLVSSNMPLRIDCGNVNNSEDVIDSSNTSENSLLAGSFATCRRCGIIFRDVSKVPNQTCDFSKSLCGTSSLCNLRSPSFNVDLISASNRRLSFSGYEKRSRNCLSPFYSARTMYGGASALLPYGNQTSGRFRTGSVSSKLDLFSTRNQINMQPVPSPNKSNDQETMSTTARRILDTLEKYCSPVIDAKRIPLKDSSDESSETSITLRTNRNIKRKLPTVEQLTPSTADLLRVKREEKLQESVSNARATASSVPDTSVIDSESSSDSTDLDYNILTENTKNSNENYVSKLTRKNEKTLSEEPAQSPKLPNAVLQITNLPKFNITNMFTFSKPLLLENLDMNNIEGTSTKEKSNKQNEKLDTIIKDKNIKSPLSSSIKNSTFSFCKPKNNNQATTKSPKELREKSNNDTSNLNSKFSTPPNNLIFSKTDTFKTVHWTCKKCFLDTVGDKCSSCSSPRVIDTIKKIDKKPTLSAGEGVSAPFVLKSNWGDHSVAADTKSTEVTSLKTASTVTDTIFTTTTTTSTSTTSTASTASTTATTSTTTTTTTMTDSNISEIWKNLTKKPDNMWKCETCLIQNKQTDTKCVACGTESSNVSVASSSNNNNMKLPFTFGVNTSSTTSNSVPVASLTSNNNESKIAPTAFSFGFSKSSETPNDNPCLNGTKDPVKIASTTPFSFGFSKSSETPNDNQCLNGTKSPSKITPTAAFSFGFSKSSETSNDSSNDNKNPAKIAPTTPFSFGFSKSSETPNDNQCLNDNKNSAKIVPATPFSFGFSKSSETPNNNQFLNVNKSPAKIAPTTPFSFGFSKSPETPIDNQFLNVNKNLGVTSNTFAASDNMETETDKKSSVVDGKDVIFNDVTSSTNNKNPLFKLSNNSNDNTNKSLTSPSVLKFPQSSLVPKENGEESSNVFNDISSSTENSKKKCMTFASFVNNESSSNSLNNTFSSNNVTKTDSTWQVPNSISVTTVSSSSSTTASSLFPLVMATGSSNDAKPNNIPSTQPSKSIFGNVLKDGFSLKKNDSSSPSTTSVQSTDGNFSTPTFNFGSNIASSANVLDSCQPGQFNFSTPGQFNFNSPGQFNFSATSNSIFPSVNKIQDMQPSVPKPAFGNKNIFGSTNSQITVTDSTKKPGGFSFAAPNQFATPTVKNFTPFSAYTNDNQTSTSSSTPFVFGGTTNPSAQTPNFTPTAPSPFNFTVGYSSSFASQPAAATTTQNPSSRKIKKAVRRTNK